MYEYLPSLLGEGTVEPYNGYKADVHPGISHVFQSAAFRYKKDQLCNLWFVTFVYNGCPFHIMDIKSCFSAFMGSEVFEIEMIEWVFVILSLM
jgi:hypothetical protein